MAEKKAHEVDAWLARPDPKIAIVLIYGPDRGLVAERARLFAAKSGVAAGRCVFAWSGSTPPRSSATRAG